MKDKRARDLISVERNKRRTGFAMVQIFMDKTSFKIKILEAKIEGLIKVIDELVKED